MPKKNELAKREDTAVLDLSTLPQANAADMEGYDESNWKAFSYIQIRQKALQDEQGKTIRDPGQFRIYNEVLGDDIPDVEILDVVILAIRGNARTRWEDEKVACRSVDGVEGSTTTEEPEHFKCADCEHRDVEGERGCRTSPLLVATHEKFGACVIKFTRSAIKSIGIYEAKRSLAAKQAGYSSSTLPPHFLQTQITTVYKEKPQPHFVPKFEIVAALDIDTLKIVREQRKSLLESFDFKPEVFEDAKIEAEVKKDANHAFYDPNDYQAG